VDEGFVFFFVCFFFLNEFAKKGLFAREKGNWREATDSFFLAQTVFAKLAEVGDADQRGVAQSRAESIAPLVAYTAYRLGQQRRQIDARQGFAGKT
jgi:hypothetical protein